MHTRTYRAKSIQEALDLVRRDLGADASVLQTREVSSSLWRWMLGQRHVEVTASTNVHVPSQLTGTVEPSFVGAPELRSPTMDRTPTAQHVPPAHETSHREMFRHNLKADTSEMDTIIDDLCEQPARSARNDSSASLFQLFTELIDAELTEDLARELVERVRQSARPGELPGELPGDLKDPVLLKSRVARMIEEEIQVCDPIRITPGKPRLAALVGPTGVGKTTTIAKLAANFRLREKIRVGLITVDTYRIAAVEQLRTYADIMDLPMEVVSTPREMRLAVDRLNNLDLILLDTAGRSPRDELKIQELKSMLNEAQPDEVHLVLSVTASTSSLTSAAERFAEVGANALILTKLDEASGLGGILPLARRCKIPLSYTTNGQNVPDDICQADRRMLARNVLAAQY